MSDNVIQEFPTGQSLPLSREELDRRYDTLPIVQNTRDQNAVRAMELAKLLYDARWDQEAGIFTQQGLTDWYNSKRPKIAPKLRPWTTRQIKFGEFLRWPGLVPNLAKFGTHLPYMAEGKFRPYWSQTNGNNEERFVQIIEMIAEDIAHPRPPKPRKPRTPRAAKAPQVKLTKAERNEIARRIMDEKIEAGRKSNQERRERRATAAATPAASALTPNTHPIIMYGKQLWPVTAEERRELGHYDYDQLFFGIHQFQAWASLLQPHYKGNEGSLAIHLRQRWKPLRLLTARYLEGPSKATMIRVLEVMELLADLYQANPNDPCRPPSDIVMLQGF